MIIMYQLKMYSETRNDHYFMSDPFKYTIYAFQNLYIFLFVCLKSIEVFINQFNYYY